ncbi:lysophospholipid acyltransferase family protein [Thalassobaculum litoreum]|uniref:1-acyl-sn-glycerol-3-phosphate acyltransferase n=1 Tax=Thalassobaculum litoreum DSM 18839 TaxID=1123362 RepID=A0A8G2EW63_9PROT|nr:lysophospholipid acyltransferase family protein [Thalassobaculum litoreum]SDG14565.1 1-acyl-sn-glycerol-3-phosphate acyltransferase [Thalassobaculum litoreum DSM 18839]
MFRVFFPSVLFYAQAAAHIGSAAYQARRGRLTNARLVQGSHALRRSLEAVGVRFEISGVEDADWTGGPYVFAANHMSALETQILPSILSSVAPCTFVVKSSLLRYPVFGPVLKGFDPIVVDRVDPRADLRQVLSEGGKRLAAGMSVIVFPQAHRTVAFDRKGFNTIGVRLARAAGVPIVPIALQTSAWSEGRWLQDIGWIVPKRPVRFAVGAPITIDADSRGAQEQVVEFIESRLSAWDDAASQSH